jgi:hypothetical protein
MAPPTLQHLYIEPYNGLCNRIRVIASAKRFQQLTGVPCTIVWDWPDFTALFEPEPSLTIVTKRPALPGDAMVLTTRNVRNTPEHLRLPLTGPPTALISTCYSFGRVQDSWVLDMSDLSEWLPKPAAAIREKAAAFRARHMVADGIIGFHIRRTDSERPFIDSPDWRFLRRAREIIAGGGRIFLATDNHATEGRLLRRFGKRVVIYPKDHAISQRWPREPDAVEIGEDYVDLLLLAGCDYVLGSNKSSYSSLAMALNGSPRSVLIGDVPITRMSMADRGQAARDYLASLPARIRELRRRYEPRLGIGRAIRQGLRTFGV